MKRTNGNFALSLCLTLWALLVAQRHAWVMPLTGGLFRRTSPTTAIHSMSLSSSNFNIVLEPTRDNPNAFDSDKIGNARVHRYSRNEDPDSETEYVMWYHGRSRSIVGADTEENGTPPHHHPYNLPPLSTGRIGRATSKNGLSWKKDLQGSASEDAPGTSLGLNKESWWGFDTAHVGLGNVLLPMSTPAVMTQEGIYLMYYFGGNFEETRIVDYVMSSTLPEELVANDSNASTATIAGMKMKIGVAVSQDGQSWGRVEGDDPSGAIMAPYEASDPNQQQLRQDASLSANMDEELYCAWPDVVVNWSQQQDKGSSFLMYYSTMTKADKKKCIAHAVSEDGFRWSKKGICLRPDELGMDADGCARCCVVRDAVYDTESNTWSELDTWKMYYEGVSPDDLKHRIMEAESDDGRRWMKKGVAFDVGATDAWDFGGVGSPHLVRMDDGLQRMYYTGQNADGSTAIGVAKLDHNGPAAVWVREQATITFA